MTSSKVLVAIIILGCFVVIGASASYNNYLDHQANKINAEFHQCVETCNQGEIRTKQICLQFCKPLLIKENGTRGNN